MKDQIQMRIAIPSVKNAHRESKNNNVKSIKINVCFGDNRDRNHTNFAPDPTGCTDQARLRDSGLGREKEEMIGAGVSVFPKGAIVAH